MGAVRVKELFSKAKSMAPAIIFIDEIDAVGKAEVVEIMMRGKQLSMNF